MAHKTSDGCWRVSVRVKGRRVTKKFPKGTPKGLVDDFERNVKLGKIDPSLMQQSVVPYFRDYFGTWIGEVGIEWTSGFLKKRQQEFRDHLNRPFPS